MKSLASAGVAAFIGAMLLGGCGWTNEESSLDPLEDSIRIYGVARVQGEVGQSELRAEKVTRAAQRFRISRRLAGHIDLADVEGSEQEDFQDELASLTMDWAAVNDRALGRARAGEMFLAFKALDRADRIGNEIDDLVEGTDFDELSDGDISNEYASELVNRDPASVK
ncbi:MAG: hypothetical protein KDB52_03820 [Solirubrobacterales bacterium]|nr:hypothetical protein [Solirubrobacterales bacterium]